MTVSIQLPVLSTVAKVYRLTLRNLGFFLKIAAPWIPLLILTSFVFDLINFPGEQEISLSPIAVQGVTWLHWFTHLIIITAIAVPWHRKLLLNEKLKQLVTPINHAARNYFTAAIAISLLVSAPLYLSTFAIDFSFPEHEPVKNQIENSEVVKFGLVTGLSATIFLTGLFYSWRLSLVLPSIALCEKHKSMEIWKKTRGNTGRIVAVGFLSVAPLLVVALLFSAGLWLHQVMQPDTLHPMLLSAALEPVFLFCELFGITALTLTYRHFFPEQT